MILNKPSRKIPKNYHNITGKFSSKKAQRLISFESKLERDFLYIFEFDLNILNILEQPLTIEYKINNKIHTYTPDFYLKKTIDERDVIVEVKYYNDLKKTFQESKYKYQAIIKYCQKNNIDFKFYTDKCQYIQNKNFMFNLHFLLSYSEINTSHYNSIYENFKPYITIQEILDCYSSNKYLQLELINTIWGLIRYQVLLVDLSSKLSLSSKIIKMKSDFKGIL